MKGAAVFARNGEAARLATVDEIVAEAMRGRMFILVDSADRENEGDLVIPAQAVTPEIINFMTRYGRGLVCLALEGGIADRLKLRPMVEHNESRHGTAFTVSIGARTGISTGISAHDRARTIRVAADPLSGPEDICSPGHVFPLRACAGGVLERPGHTEASVAIARMAGYEGAAVICEIMNDDGSMARMPDLERFAALHDMKIGRINDIVAGERKQ